MKQLAERKDKFPVEAIEILKLTDGGLLPQRNVFPVGVLLLQQVLDIISHPIFKGARAYLQHRGLLHKIIWVFCDKTDL